MALCFSLTPLRLLLCGVGGFDVEQAVDSISYESALFEEIQKSLLSDERRMAAPLIRRAEAATRALGYWLATSEAELILQALRSSATKEFGRDIEHQRYHNLGVLIDDVENFSRRVDTLVDGRLLVEIVDRHQGG